MIQFSCPTCLQQLELSDAAAGRSGKCPHCQAPIQVPSALAPSANAGTIDSIVDNPVKLCGLFGAALGLLCGFSGLGASQNQPDDPAGKVGYVAGYLFGSVVMMGLLGLGLGYLVRLLQGNNKPPSRP